MDTMLVTIKDKLSIPFLLVVLGILLLIIGASDTISIGNSYSQISLSQPTRFVLWVPAFVLIGAGLWQLVRKQSRKTIKSREKIMLENRRLITNAQNEVISFSGDLSWTENTHPALMAAVDHGVSIRILCKDPLTKKAKAHIQRYLQQPGIELRYYPPKLDPDVRGLMMDPQTTKYLFLVEKKHRTKGFNYQRDGTPGNTTSYEYWGQVFTAREDLSIVAPLAKFFNALWELSLEATVLDEADWLTIEREIRRLPQYQSAEINVDVVRIADLKPLHRFIEISRYEVIKAQAERMKIHGIPLWSHYSLLTPSYKRIVCPPIVEYYKEGKFVIIDGLARIYEAKQLNLTEVTVCTIKQASGPLPSTPWEWDDVRVVADGVYSKQENFQNLKLDYWRPIKSAIHALTQPVEPNAV